MKFDLSKLSRVNFTMRPTGFGSDDDWVVLVDGVICGRIMLTKKAFGVEVYFWTVTGPYVPPHLQPSHGESDTLEQAQVDFKVKMKTWLGWAWSSGQGMWNGDMEIG